MLRYLLEKEFTQIVRNPFLPRMILVFPFVVLLIMPLAANFEVKDIRLIIVDLDMSSSSRQLTQKATASGYFLETGTAADYNAAIRAVDLGYADIILQIPQGFEKELTNEDAAAVSIAVDTVNGTKGGLGSSYLSAIIAEFTRTARPNSRLAPFSIMPMYRYNPHLRYPVFMVPALMVMLLTMICGFLPALNIVGEKEKGTIEQINVTPVSRIIFILSKLIPYWVIGFIVLSVCFFVAFAFYGLLPAGSPATIYLFASIFILAISGFGLVISNYAETVQQAMFMMFFFVISFIFLSGLYTPVASMPDWAQKISDFSPLKYFIQVIRAIYLKGSDISELQSAFAAAGGFAIFFNGWAVLSYRKKS